MTYHVDVPGAGEAPVYVHGIHGDTDFEVKRRAAGEEGVGGGGESDDALPSGRVLK